jgi:2-C-methyl-D-erythritol 4-phosphate cytidylyltransferase
MNTAIIVAAGIGQRFAGSQPKQFIELLGRPLITHTLEKFESCPSVDEIILVLSQEGRERSEISNFRSQIKKLKQVITGGKTRAESVKNGLDAIANATSYDIVAVHDGARPLVSVDEITRTIEKASETGAACLVADVTDTIKQVENKHISGTVDRSTLRRALTPQAFHYDILRKAFEGADLSGSITDECYLVERLGVNISVIPGSARNIKITRAEDLILAEAYLSREQE